jgi:hypothetical protein
MSSTAFIAIDNYPIETFSNYFDPWLFKKSDRQIQTRKRSERNRLVWVAPDPEDMDEPEQWYLYVATAETLKRRSELAGCTTITLDQEFAAGIGHWLDALRRSQYQDERVRAHIRTLQTASLSVWLDKLRLIMKRGLRYNRWERTDYEDGILDIMLNYDPRYEIAGVWCSSELNFPCMTFDGFARAFLEAVSDDSQCTLDVTELVDGGWTDAFDDLAEHNRAFTSAYDTFDAAINEIRSLMDLSPDNPSLVRLLYANAITSMEAYLADTVKKNVLTREPLLRRFVESHPSFKDMKLTMAGVFRAHGEMKTQVRKILDDTSFHHIDRAIAIYRSVFCAEFPRELLGPLHRAIENRHHIVHRNGKDDSGKLIELTRADLEHVITVVTATISAIDTQVKEGLIDPDDL